MREKERKVVAVSSNIVADAAGLFHFIYYCLPRDDIVSGEL